MNDPIRNYDNLTPEQRRYTMSRVHSKNSQAELAVRRILHRMGYRFRLHRKDLPGKPDLVLPRHRKIIFVHGCFWHGHLCRSGRNQPKSHRSYWGPKIERNRKRDTACKRRLRRLGWSVLVLWECQIKNETLLRNALTRFLE